MDVKTKWQKNTSHKLIFHYLRTCKHNVHPNLDLLPQPLLSWPKQMISRCFVPWLGNWEISPPGAEERKNATIYQAYFIHAGTGTMSFYKPVKKTLQYVILHVCDEWRRHFKNLQVELRKHWSMIQTVKNICRQWFKWNKLERLYGLDSKHQTKHICRSFQVSSTNRNTCIYTYMYSLMFIYKHTNKQVYKYIYMQMDIYIYTHVPVNLYTLMILYM